MAVAAVVLVAVVLKVLTGVGPALPGPKIGSVFGEGDRPPARQCTASPRRILTPATPRPGAGRWRIEPSSPETLSELEAATVSGLVYLVGGQGPGGRSVATVTAFDPRTRTFKHVPDLPERGDHAPVGGPGGGGLRRGGHPGRGAP